MLAATRSSDGTPGAAYLASRKVWPATEPLPWCVRWLPLGRAPARLRPRLPSGCAGCLVYLFAPLVSLADGGSRSVSLPAAQLEAVDGAGRRVAFDRAGKRPSVAGSRFGAGSCTFRPRMGSGRVLHLTEGPLDALALASSGVVTDACATVAGAAEVHLWPDGDPPGRGAAVRLKLALRRLDPAPDVIIHRLPDGADLADWRPR